MLLAQGFNPDNRSQLFNLHLEQTHVMVKPVFERSSINVTRYVASPSHLDLSFCVFLPHTTETTSIVSNHEACYPRIDPSDSGLPPLA